MSSAASPTAPARRGPPRVLLGLSIVAAAMLAMALVAKKKLAEREALGADAPGTSSARAPAIERLPRLHEVPDFTLTERSGKPLGLADLRGQVWIACFFFATCKGPCPKLSAEMAELDRALSGEPKARLVSISVDPANDTPEALAAYATQFQASPRWLFLTGPMETVEMLGTDGLKVANGKERSGEIFHSPYFVLVDATSRVRGYYNVYADGELARKRLLDDARILLLEAGR